MENTIFTIILYLLPVFFFYCPIIKGIKAACDRRQRLNSIPFATKKELLALAQEYGIQGVNRLKKYDLQNVLIAKLC
ncbi:Rho termination factor N-terminal domain-containing protein [Myxosarcina sp. GI1]|uniref:Rho termination factor N-terminal domain-containing protein n=1 Tax=Myxosarcina sp. GI1 TaxID=1541065 RepID=UPI00056A6CD7|nr:Rho termination factor N-terminal domain-containing protein [Myxosarcina sp. GI1]